MPSGPDDIAKAMASLRRALESRIRHDDRVERARAARPVRSGTLAAYDMAALARRLRPMLEYDGRGWRVLAAEIGVTSPDLSRVMAGQDIAVQKVFAICDWAGLDARRFYRAPTGAPPPRKRPRPAFKAPREKFHGKSTETAGADTCSTA
ncbi:hypothetical protein [Mesorhizobium sp. SP-1A]|uniref:hypothetical protein n=1 Tax=Mesorhizobium sp. SP-1A TaxID=3077840 RepID=UPI0028F6E358|nr:hypothetical protein [Mesorhizobium sp. SP-1A]